MLNIVKQFDLFVFDLDDTLVKTEYYHYNAWIKTLKNRLNKDFNITFDFFVSKFHSKYKDSINNYITIELGLKDIDSIIKEKSDSYLNILNENLENIKMIDGAHDLINLIIKYNKKFVIVSNSLKSNIDFFLNLFPILKNSSKNYYREILKNKKPNPECYLKICDDFPFEKKIGFEDSITGIEALTQLKDITPFFINNNTYFYYNYIIANYDVININNYNDLDNIVI
jgi:beta-phosphoglucomutase-like phosphatase (HAD superfamily)